MTLPDDLYLLYQGVILGGLQSPGVVTLSGHDRTKNWDVQAAKGQTGASSKLNGNPIGTFTATFYLAGDHSEAEGDDDDFERWDKFKKLVESTTNGPKPIALPIYHPDLLAQGFTEVCNGGISGMVHDGKGGATVTVKFIEFKPPKKKKIASATGKPGTVTPTPDPNAAAKVELIRLTAIAKTP